MDPEQGLRVMCEDILGIHPVNMSCDELTIFLIGPKWSTVLWHTSATYMQDLGCQNAT